MIILQNRFGNVFLILFKNRALYKKRVMSLTNFLKSGTFGVELEVCACLFDMIDKYNQIQEFISKQLAKKGKGPIKLPKELTTGLPKVALDEVQSAAQNRNPLYEMERMMPYEAYFTVINECGATLGEKPMIPLEFIRGENDYTAWAMDKDGSIRCGFEEIQEKYAIDAMGDDYDPFENEIDEEIMEAAANESGMIVPKANKTGYARDYMELCEEHILHIEVISRMYHYPELDNFLAYLDTCIYNDAVIYELNTSQGLHISIGNSLVNSGEHDPRTWVENLVSLWWKYEEDVLALVPKFRIDLGNDKYSVFARPLTTRFGSLKELHASEEGTGRPMWELFYARQNEGFEIGENPFSEDEDLKDVKYTTLNIKGIQITPDREVVYTDKVFAEFRMLPASHNPDLMASWITLLSAFGALAMDEELSKAAIEGGKTKLPNIFGELKGTVTKAIAGIKQGNKAEVLLTSRDYEASQKKVKGKKKK